MKDFLIILIIALVVVIVGAAIIYGRSLVKADKEKKALHRRRVEDEERERLFSPIHSKAEEGDIPVYVPEREGPIGHIHPKNRLADFDTNDTIKTLPVIEERK